MPRPKANPDASNQTSAAVSASTPAREDDANPFASLLSATAPAGEKEGSSEREDTIHLQLPPEPTVPATFSDSPPLGWGDPPTLQEELRQSHQLAGGRASVPDPTDALLHPPVTTPATHTPGEEAFPKGRANQGPTFPSVADPDQLHDAEARERRRSLLEDALNAKLARDPPKHPTSEPAKLPGLPASGSPPKPSWAQEGEMDASVKWTTRTRVTSAWQFDGKTHEAPPWVDRNWIGYDGGPALIIPEVGTVRLSQWIVTQDILDERGAGVSRTEIKIYDDKDFRSLYMQEREKS